MRALRFVSLLMVITAFSSGSAYAEMFQPVPFDGNTTLSFEPDVRLHPGTSGTIELWVAAPNQISTNLVTVVQHDNNYRVGLFGHRKAVYLEILNGPKSYVVEAKMDLTDGQYHHVAFVIDGGMATVLVDGEWAQEGGKGTDAPQRTVRSHAPFRPAVSGGTALRLGGEPGRYFEGYLYALRIWNRPLGQAELQWTRRFYGWPEVGPNDSMAFKNLNQAIVAYASFTDKERALHYPDPEVLETSRVGGFGGTAFFIGPYHARKSFTYGIKQVFAQVLPPFILAFGVQGLDGQGRSVALLPPMIPSPNRESEVVEKWAALSRNLADSSSPAAVREAYRKDMEETQFGFDPDSADDIARLQTRMDYHFFQLPPGEQITAISGTHNYSTIETLRFHTKTTESAIFRQTAGQNGYMAFHLALPPGAVFAGLVGSRTAEEKLESIGLAYTLPSLTPQQTDRLYASLHPWIAESQQQPQKVFDPNNHALKNSGHGTYALLPAYRLLFNDIGHESEILAIQDAGNERVQAGRFLRTVGSFSYVLTSFDTNRWYYPLPFADKGGVLLTAPNDVRFFGVAHVLPAVLLPPDPQEEGDSKDKITWGGTFSLDQRPTLLTANFQGYHIFRMDPRNLQSNTGAPGRVFAYPSEASRAFSPTDSKIIVPHGLTLVVDNRADEGSETTTIDNEEEYKRSWSGHLGISAGVPVLFSFKENVSMKNEMAQLNKQEYKRVVAKSVETRYALVQDRARIKLSDELTQLVLELRDRYRAGLPSDFPRLFERFGTHYPHAVTYGGMALLEIDFQSTESTNSNSSEKSIEVEVSGMIEELSLGAKGGTTVSQAQRNTQGFSKERIRFNTYGGSMSQGQGWSLPKGEEVPIYLDLRPIYELLSPLYFDDEVIWTDLRRELVVNWNALMGVTQ
ncbi:MAG: hypothetical protein JSS38_08150 [Nitrospira sp.]|nr:hypothetical protein [Nitrospira sp.]